MKTFLLFLLALPMVALADTPPPGTVKAKTYTGDGLTPITSTGATGALDVNVTNSGGLSTVNQGNAGVEAWLVDGSAHSQPVIGTFWQATQPVSLVSLPSLAAGSNTIGNVNVVGTVPVSGTFWQATQPVSAASLPLPTGAATAANQSTEISSLATIATNTTNAGTPVVSGTVTANAGTGTFTVDGSGHTQPVSAASLPLPTGAATSANQSTEIASLSSIDTKTPALGQALAAGSVPVVLTASQLSTLTPLSSVTVSGTVTANAGTGTFTVDGSGHTQPISAGALPLPSGAATAAKQPALGTAGSASADVISVQGVASMTALKVDGSAVTQPVSGTVTANAGTGTFTVDASGHTVPVSGTFWQATQPVSGTVTANIGTSGSLALNSTVAGLQVAQGSTTSGQTGSLSLGAVTTSGPTYTTGQSSPFSLTTAGALRIDGSSTTQPVSGTFWQATQPVSLSTLPALVAGTALIGKVGIDQTTPGTTNGVQVNAALPAGSAVIGKVSIDQTTPGTTNLVALAANQSVNVAQINGTTPLMGNGVTGTGSQRVTIASDNTAFSVNAIPKTPAAVTVKQAAITVGTSAVRLTNDGLVPPSTRVLLVAQLLSSSTANCYFGSSGVTTTSTTRGVQMFAGAVLSFNNDAGDYYAICDASSQTIFITEQE